MERAASSHASYTREKSPLHLHFRWKLALSTRLLTDMMPLQDRAEASRTGVINLF